MSTVNASVNAATAAGNNILHFAFVPLSLVVGMTIADTTTPTALPANATVFSIDRVGNTVTMNLNAAGAGVGSSDSLTFTATDTLDYHTIYATIISQEFQSRQQLQWLIRAATIAAGSPNLSDLNFCAALFRGIVPLNILAQAVLIDATNRANCLLDATIPGGKITDAGIAATVVADFDTIAGTRNWQT